MSTQGSLISAIKAGTPNSIRLLSRQVKQWARERQNRGKTARDVFTEIYTAQMWGEAEDRAFFSGPGSDPGLAEPYADFVRRFIADHGIGHVVDLGCGDFRVGGLIAPACTRYTGVDIVEPLIEENRRRDGSDSISFQCLDITTDSLPDGELCLIREVLQHLSNRQIQMVLAGISKYPFVLVTDIRPADSTGFRVNKDKVHGASSRLSRGSVLQLDQPPFNVAGLRQVFETELPYSPSCALLGTRFHLCTFLIRHT